MNLVNEKLESDMHLAKSVGLNASHAKTAKFCFVAIWIVSIFLLVYFWSELPDWVKPIGILGVLPIPIPGTALVTALLVLSYRQPAERLVFINDEKPSCPKYYLWRPQMDYNIEDCWKGISVREYPNSGMR